MSLATLVVLAAAIASSAAQQLQVNTPTSVQACLPVQLSWTGVNPPYYVSLIPGGQASAASVKDFGEQSGNDLVWNVDQPTGSSLTVQIRDSKGTLNYSDKFTVQSSSAICNGTSTSTSTPPVTTGTAVATPPKNGTTNTTSTTPSTGASTSTTGSTGKTGNTTTTTTSTTTPTTSSTTGTTTNTTASTHAASSGAHVTPGMLALGVSALVAIFA